MESENMLCVVKALDIMPWWGVVGAPEHFGDDLDAAWGEDSISRYLYTWFIMWSWAGTSLWRFGSGRLSVMLSRK